jgi:hypothetical protein
MWVHSYLQRDIGPREKVRPSFAAERLRPVTIYGHLTGFGQLAVDVRRASPASLSWFGLVLHLQIVGRSPLR